jgi:hypothetical protein
MKLVYASLYWGIVFLVGMGAHLVAIALGFDRAIGMCFAAAMCGGFALLVEREKEKTRAAVAIGLQEMLKLRFGMDDNGKKDKSDSETRTVNGAGV